MRKIFIDCGAHCGCSRRTFEETRPDYEIYSFEPDPELNQFCPDLINKAVWVEDGKRTFYKFGIDGGSTLSLARADLFKVRKPHYYAREDMEVECIDLAKFILQFDKSDYIILKLDIEGAEYEVIPHLIDAGAIQYVDEFYIEWHDERAGISPMETYKLKNQLTGMGLIPVDWNAMGEHCRTENDPNRKQFHAR